MLEFPSNPADGETVYQSDNGVTYQWNAADTRWESGGTTGSSLVSGTVVQSVSVVDPTYLTGTSGIALNDQKPQIGQGDEIVGLATTFTPKFASSKLQLDLSAFTSFSVAQGIVTISVYANGVGDPVYTMAVVGNVAGNIYPVSGQFEYAAGTVLPIDFTVRIGVTSGSWYLNGGTVDRFFGGALNHALRITEIQPNAVVPAPNAFNDYLAGYGNTGLSGTGINELDDIAVNSMYLVPPSPVNAPPDYLAGSGGFIITMAASPNGAVQYIYGRGNNSQKQWTRTKTSGAWGAWVLVVDGGAFTQRLAGYADTGFLENFAGDLNSIVTNSTYTISASTSTNVPDDLSTASLVTLDTKQINAGAARQIIYGRGLGSDYKQWMRSFESAAWTSWVLVVDGVGKKRGISFSGNGTVLWAKGLTVVRNSIGNYTVTLTEPAIGNNLVPNCTNGGNALGGIAVGTISGGTTIEVFTYNSAGAFIDNTVWMEITDFN